MTHVADRDGYSSSPAAALLDSGAMSGTGGTPFNISCEGDRGRVRGNESCSCEPLSAHRRDLITYVVNATPP